MRGIFSLSLLLLVLTLLLNAEAVHRDRAQSTPEARSVATGGTTVRIFSMGAGLPQERFHRRERSQEIIVNGDQFSWDTGENGLRVASFPLEGGDVVHSNYDLMSSSAHLEAFVHAVEDAPLHTVLAMTVFRTIDPRGEGMEERVQRLDGLFETLGAAVHPHRSFSQSWAFLCVRTDGGWLPLVERASRTKGLMLAYNLPSDPAALDARARPRPGWESHRRRHLLSVFPYGVTGLEGRNTVRQGPGAAFEVNHVQRDGFSASPEAPSDEHHLTFPYVPLGAAPLLEVEVGVESYHRPGCAGLVFEVFIDGELAGQERLGLDASEPDAWLPWTVDLSPWARRWVRLELRTRKVEGHAGSGQNWFEPAVWADPTLIDTAIAPEEAADIDRYATFLLLDGSHDGLLLREEISPRFFELLDSDGDGRVSLAENPPGYPGLVTRMDSDGSGFVETPEVEPLYDDLDRLVFGR